MNQSIGRGILTSRSHKDNLYSQGEGFSNLYTPSPLNNIAANRGSTTISQQGDHEYRTCSPSLTPVPVSLGMTNHVIYSPRNTSGPRDDYFASARKPPVQQIASASVRHPLVQAAKTKQNALVHEFNTELARLGLSKTDVLGKVRDALNQPANISDTRSNQVDARISELEVKVSQKRESYKQLLV